MKPIPTETLKQKYTTCIHTQAPNTIFWRASPFSTREEKRDTILSLPTDLRDDPAEQFTGSRGSVVDAGIVVDQNQSLRFALDIARGMEFLHSMEPMVPNFLLTSKHIMVMSPGWRHLVFLFYISLMCGCSLVKKQSKTLFSLGSGGVCVRGMPLWYHGWRGII